MLKLKYEDAFGFEIKHLKNAKLKAEKLKALKEHLSILEGLSNEAISDIENRISALNMD